MKIDTELLKQIGLTDGEIKVYLALINLGSSSTGNIIKDAKVHASKVYPILERLIDKGLVSFIKEGKKTIFSANPPKTIISYLEEKEQEIEKQKKSANSLVKSLEMMKLYAEAKTEATIFRGIKGFEVSTNNFIRSLKNKKEVIIFGVSEFKPTLKIRFLDALKQIKNPIRICVNETQEELAKEIKAKNIKKKLIQEEFSIPSLIFIHENIAIIVAGQGNTTFYIENKEIADSFKAYFENFWQSKTRTYYGKKGAVRLLQELAQEAKKGNINYGYGTPENPYAKYLPQELEWWFEQEKKYKFDTRLIFMEGGEHRQPNAKVRYLPKEFLSPVRVVICGNKVMLVDFTEPWTTIIIEKEEIAKSFINHFNVLWNIAKPTKKK